MKINLLPNSERPSTSIIARLGSVIIIIGVVLLLVLTGLTIKQWQIVQDLRDEYDLQTVARREMDIEISQLTGLQSRVRELYERQEKYQGLVSDEFRIQVGHLRSIVRRVPEGIWLERIAVQRGQAVVDGYGFRMSVVSSFLHDLNLPGMYSKARDVEQDERSGLIIFSIDVQEVKS